MHRFLQMTEFISWYDFGEIIERTLRVSMGRSSVSHEVIWSEGQDVIQYEKYGGHLERNEGITLRWFKAVSSRIRGKVLCVLGEFS